MATPRALRVVADGPTADSCRVLDAETGEPIAGVVRANIRIEVGHFNVVELVLEGIEVDVVASEPDAP